MGQKVNPHGLRVGVIKDWDSRWYAREDKVGDLIVEDYNIRKYLKTNLYAAGIAKIEIERDNAKVKINIHCSRPGVVIGKGGTEIEKLRQKVADMIGKNVVLNIIEIRSPDLNAQLVAENIAAQLEKRISFRRAMKQAMQRATRLGAKGIKCTCGGRLGGAEIARSESYHEGTIPLQTLRADPESRHRVRLRRGQHHLRQGRLQGLDLQGRGPQFHPALHRRGAARPPRAPRPPRPPSLRRAS